MASNIQEQEIERRIFDCISEDLPPDQWKHLGFNLGLTFDHLSEVDISSFGQPTLYNNHLWDKWKHLQNPKPYQLIPLLSSALEAIGHNDIVKKIKQIKLEKKTEERKVKTGTIKEPEKFIQKIFNHIADKLPPNQWQSLGNKLGVSKNVLMDLEIKKNVQGHVVPYTVTLMLETWRHKRNPPANELVALLKPHLEGLDCEDIACDIQRIHDEEVKNALR